MLTQFPIWWNIKEHGRPLICTTGSLFAGKCKQGSFRRYLKDFPTMYCSVNCIQSNWSSEALVKSNDVFSLNPTTKILKASLLELEQLEEILKKGPCTWITHLSQAISLSMTRIQWTKPCPFLLFKAFNYFHYNVNYPLHTDICDVIRPSHISVCCRGEWG